MDEGREATIPILAATLPLWERVARRPARRSRVRGRRLTPTDGRVRGWIDDLLRLSPDVADTQIFYDGDAIPPRPFIEVKLTRTSAINWTLFTQAHVGQIADILVDGNIMVAPRINEPQSSGFVWLHGSFSVEQAALIAKRLTAHEARLTVSPRGR
jgi:hypothetical protein